jgi:hypothetical protein
MQRTLQPGKRCGNPQCGEPIPEGVASFMLTIQGKLREVCETCFDAWLNRVKKSKKHSKRS